MADGGISAFFAAYASEIAIGTAAVAAAGTAVSADQSNKAQAATNKAQKKAAAIDRGNARFQHQKKIRQAIAEGRIERGEILASAFAENGGANSSVTGAVGSLQSDTAGTIGASNTDVASSTGQSLILEHGADRATKFGNRANTFKAIASIAGATSSVASGFQTTGALSPLSAGEKGKFLSQTGSGAGQISRFGTLSRPRNLGRFGFRR